MRHLSGAQVALEATSNSWAVVRVLRPLVAAVLVSNPVQTRAIAQAKVKTDKVDAEVLAQLLRCDFLPLVWQPDEATQELRSLTRRRAALVGMQTAIKNRLHAVLAERLLTIARHTTICFFSTPAGPMLTTAAVGCSTALEGTIRAPGGSPGRTSCAACAGSRWCGRPPLRPP